VDFLLVLIELFFARCYGRGTTGENRLKIGDFAPIRSLWPKISGRRGCLPQSFCTDSFRTKKHCSRLSSSEVPFFTENGRFAF